MKQIKGPAIFLAQFVGDEAPFNNLPNICRWAASLGYKGVQIPSGDKRLFDLEQAAQSQEYCDSINAIVKDAGLCITELSTHLQGQLVAVHPAYDEMFDNFAPDEVKGQPQARQKWATEQLLMAAKASQRLGLKSHATFSGALLWHTMYPWPQRPQGLVEQGFEELAKRWLPILDAFDKAGVDVCYELHPGEDLHDGATFERFLAATNNHPRAHILYDPSHFVLQQLDYLQFIDIYHQRIKAFHVKDAEFNASGRAGVYGGYLDWQARPGRFRSLGDGQINFGAIFSKLTQYGFDGWAVLEWECCIKHPESGAREGAEFIAKHLITPTDKAFDDFAGASTDSERNKRILGIN
ncbi:sugar phosphate isomerase/epimerase family protein [Pseudoalteromonas sp. T1lg10]|uniref:sugar phosphate isomerase/epimerase family protein n=1 Tax=Pseudoalteromonas sp. T1lg10 TaxID=2077093 RepID=UPI000CF72DBE|nr:sugar phosphate isomerase/epimerase [Pseudoalteromonas sp. T1lg10]